MADTATLTSGTSDDEPFCRDCADENGTCPADGLPCDRYSRPVSAAASREPELVALLRDFQQASEEATGWSPTGETSTHPRDAARLRERLFAQLTAALAERDAEIARLTEWRDSVLRRLEAMQEFQSASWSGDKRGWGFVFEFIGWLHRERNRLTDALNEIARLTAERDEALADTARLDTFGRMLELTCGGQLFSTIELTFEVLPPDGGAVGVGFGASPNIEGAGPSAAGALRGALDARAARLAHSEDGGHG